MTVQQAQYRVYVRNNTTLTLVGEVDQYDKLTYIKTFNGLGSFVLQLDSTHAMAPYLADPAYGIIIDRITASGVTTDFSGPCRYFQRQGGDRKKLIVKGYDDLHWLYVRQAYPVTSYPYQTILQNDAPQVSYTFGDTSGTTAHDIFFGGIYNGTYSGGFTLNQTGLIDDPSASVLLNGTTGYISVPTSNLPTSLEWSYEVWFYYTGAPVSTAVLCFMGTASSINATYMGILNTGIPTMQVKGVNINASNALATGLHHMMMTYSDPVASLYVDGVQVASGSQSGATITFGSAAFGCYGAGSSNFFGGKLQYGAIYSNPINAAEILVHYRVGISRYNASQFDSQTGAAETVIKHYVSANAGSSAFTERQVPNLTIETDSGRGSTVTFNARFEQLIAKDGASGILQFLATAGGIGFRVVQTNTPALQFQVYVPANKQSTAIFSEGLGNLGDYTYEVDAQDIQNYLIAGGGGSGTSRTFATGANTSSESTYGRAEGFLNAGSSTSTSQLATQITGQLDAAAEKTTFNAVLIETDALQYGRDFNLGDTVTVYVDGATLQDIVRQVQIDLDPNNGEVITPIIGTPTAGQILAALRKFEKSNQALANRVAVLERAS